uniref:hypothetical protein n=1 Tax=Streptomyces sp. CRN 30 TaxID=3075613 RepID=UPI002A800CCC
MPLSCSRRGFVRATGGAAAALGFAGTAAAVGAGGGPAGSEGEFARLRETWRGLILGSGFRPTAEPF